MKEQDLDTFVGKKVKVTSFDNDVQFGLLYKIVESYIPDDKFQIPHAIRNGYYLHRYFTAYGGGIDYRRSHIKKIELWDGVRRK